MAHSPQFLLSGLNFYWTYSLWAQSNERRMKQL